LRQPTTPRRPCSQENKYIADLEAQLKSSSRICHKAHLSTAKERADHLKYEESTVRRSAHRMTGQTEKFEEKASKEEREYFEAVRAQKAAEDHHALLLRNRDEALKARADVQGVAHRHNQLQTDLDALYTRIFQGATPEFPEEDQQEQTTVVAQNRYDQLAARWDTEKTALGILGEAQRIMQSVLYNMNEAHNSSQ